MANKIQNAVDRLNKILPLADRQKQLSPETADVYQQPIFTR